MAKQKVEMGQMKEQEMMVREALKKIKNKVMILSGKGGVGKSTVSVCLATDLANRGYKTGILDVDLHGPSVPRMLGISGLLDIDSEKHLIPKTVMKNLSVVSIEYLLADKNQAVIWRGPLKHSAIAQFIGQVAWGELDYLVIDSPPGTGDEPLSVAQLIPDAKGVIVTQPQEISLADVRKCITFCKHVEMEPIGIIENMSGIICPHCGKKFHIFKSGGGEKIALITGLPFLGTLNFDPDLVDAADKGKLVSYMSDEKRPYNQDFKKITDNVIKRVEETRVEPISVEEIRRRRWIRVAIPLFKDKVAPILPQADEIAVFHVIEGRIEESARLRPEGKHTITPADISQLKVNLVILKDIKEKAKYVFNRYKIGVVSNAPDLPPEKLIEEFLAGRLGGD
ncbi:MAG: P-loop NTPase [Deltaproteobacteria bacterium]|nr:P-loop NTPase [Deltaproteobacteria bacterium]